MRSRSSAKTLKDESIDHVDPVCGKKVKADSGYGMMYKTRLYRFCSRSCLDEFERSPDNFTSRQVEESI